MIVFIPVVQERGRVRKKAIRNIFARGGGLTLTARAKKIRPSARSPKATEALCRCAQCEGSPVEGLVYSPVGLVRSRHPLDLPSSARCLAR